MARARACELSIFFQNFNAGQKQNLITGEVILKPLHASSLVVLGKHKGVPHCAAHFYSNVIVFKGL